MKRVEFVLVTSFQKGRPLRSFEKHCCVAPHKYYYLRNITKNQLMMTNTIQANLRLHFSHVHYSWWVSFPDVLRVFPDVLSVFRRFQRDFGCFQRVFRCFQRVFGRFQRVFLDVFSVFSDVLKSVFGRFSECLRTRDSLRYYNRRGEAATDDDGLVLCKAFRSDAFSLGQLVLRSLQEKGTEYTRTDTMVRGSQP